MIDYKVTSNVQVLNGNVAYFIYFFDARGCRLATYFAWCDDWSPTR